MKISQEHVILITNLYLLSKLPDNGWKLAEENPQECSVRSDTSGPCAQSGGQAKRHRSARAREAAILPSSVHRIIHRDLQLKCFKRRRAQQLLSEANRISLLTR